MKYYAFESGSERGIVTSWEACKNKVEGVSGARHKAFLSEDAAKDWLGTQRTEKVAAGGVFFDAGTGRGKGVEVNVTDEFGKPMLSIIIKKSTLTPHKTLVLKGKTNNFGELTGLLFALLIAKKKKLLHIYGDSRLIIDYWSKGVVRVYDEATKKLSIEVTALRKEFEEGGGAVMYIPGSSNPADLGFHRP